MGAKEDKYVQKLKARLDEWNAEIKKLAADAEHAEAQTKIDYEKKLEELKRKKEELEEKIVAVEGGRQSSWEDFKEGVDNSWKIFKRTLSKTKSEFKHGYREGKK